MKPSLSVVLIALLASLSCRSTPAFEPTSHAALLSGWVTGSFSSAAQAKERPEDYFDIRLYMVPIWTERGDGHWLYVEQAAASALERPYRQRVYHLLDTPEGVRSDIYQLPGDPLDYAGAWLVPEVFDTLAPEQLTEREGCSIHLDLVGETYEGSTRGEACSSSLAGAAYATSEVSRSGVRIRVPTSSFENPPGE